MHPARTAWAARAPSPLHATHCPYVRITFNIIICWLFGRLNCGMAELRHSSSLLDQRGGLTPQCPPPTCWARWGRTSRRHRAAKSRLWQTMDSIGSSPGEHLPTCLDDAVQARLFTSALGQCIAHRFACDSRLDLDWWASYHSPPPAPPQPLHPHRVGRSGTSFQPPSHPATQPPTPSHATCFCSPACNAGTLHSPRSLEVGRAALAAAAPAVAACPCCWPPRRRPLHEACAST